MAGVLAENSNCQETYASFRLGGHALNTGEVTTRIGLAPDFAIERGERRQGDDVRGGVWLLGTRGRLESTNVERHLILLLDMLEPRRDEVLAVAAEQGLSLDFFCFWVSATGHGGPEVSPETLARIAALHSSLGFDFYDGSSDNES